MRQASRSSPGSRPEQPTDCGLDWYPGDPALSMRDPTLERLL